MNEIQVLAHFWRRIWEVPALKAIGIALAWVGRLFLGPIVTPAYSAVITLWLLDMFTGIWAARRDPQDAVRSKRLAQGIVKFALYLVLLSAGRQIRVVFFWFVGTTLQSIIEGAVIMTLILSVCENADRLGALYGINIPIVRQLIKFVRGRQEQSLAELERGAGKNDS